MATFVLVPGGWSGGWQWKAVAKAMQAEGHEVYRVTLTGLGERVHLASPSVTMETHIQDVVNVLDYELLADVILVGYSYSGTVVTGVAEVVPHRLKELVYFDAFVPQNGESFADQFPPPLVETMETQARLQGNGWLIPHNPPDADRRTPQPLNVSYYKFVIGNPQAAALPRTYIACTAPVEDPVFNQILSPVRAAAQRARQNPTWRYREIKANHGDFWETHVQETAELLMSFV